MQLEVISEKPKGTARSTPILFVHGAYGGAWVWEPHFLPYFAKHGYAAHALSLRGHGASEGRESLFFTRLRDYVADLEQVVAKMEAPPILVGHSMGGMVVQKYMHEHPVPAAVLMASVPPHGMVGTFFGMAFTNPGLFTELAMVQMFGPAVSNGQSVRKAFFSDATPEETIQKVMPRMQAESTLVIMDLMGMDLPPLSRPVDLPVLVLGAEQDRFIYPGALQATAEHYDTEAEIFSGMAHAMMLDHDWEKVADKVLEWLDEPSSTDGRNTPSRTRRCSS